MGALGAPWRAPGLAGIAIVAWLASACAAVRQVAGPLRPPPGDAAEVARAIESRGRALTIDLFAPGGTLTLANDSVLDGAALAAALAGEPGPLPFADITYTTRRVHVCPDGAIQIGTFTAVQRLPGGVAPVEGRWRARWVRDGVAWGIRSAALRPPWLEAPPPGDAACVGPAEARAWARRTSVVAHAPHPAGIRRGLEPGLLAEMRYAGWEDAVHRPGARYHASIRHRHRGAWGAELLAGHAGGDFSATHSDGDPVELGSAVSFAGLLLMHERRYLRLAAGPAAVNARWRWSGDDGMSSSRLKAGWVNEVSLTLPLRGALFVDVSYQDRIFGRSAPPAHRGVEPAEQRLGGAYLGLGLGGRF